MHTQRKQLILFIFLVLCVFNISSVEDAAVPESSRPNASGWIRICSSQLDNNFVVHVDPVWAAAFSVARETFRSPPYLSLHIEDTPEAVSSQQTVDYKKSDEGGVVSPKGQSGDRNIWAIVIFFLT